MKECRKLCPTGLIAGKQGFTNNEGISIETAGADAICMHLLTIPPGSRGKAHKHSLHETAIYMLEGVTIMHWGQALEHTMEVAAGDIIYIPADMPHLPFNPGPGIATAVIAHTDPHEQESVVLLPELEGLVG